MIQKKVFGWMLCLILVLSMTVGCQAGNSGISSSDEHTSPGTDSGNGNAEQQPEEVTLRFSWWGSEERHKALLEAIDLYMEKNPHVTIEPEYGGFDGYYQKLVTQFAGNTAPDLTPLSFDWIQEIAVNGDLVHDLFTLQDVINLEAFDQELLQKYTVFDGKLVGLPMGVNGMVTIYNKEFFQRYNIPEDTKWDWETIHQIGKQIHEQNPEDYLFGLLDEGIYRKFLMPYVNQKTGNPFIKDDYTLGFDAAVIEEAFTYYKSLLDDGVLEPVEESKLYSGAEDNVRWLNGHIGMTVSLASTIPSFANGPEVDVSSYPIPADAKTSGVIVNPSNPLAISKSSKHPEEAAKFASWLLTSPEAAEILKGVYSVPAVPASMDLLEEKHLVDPTIIRAVEIALENPGDPVNGISGNSEVDQLATDYLDQVAFNQLTPKEAAEEFISRLQDKLADMQ